MGYLEVETSCDPEYTNELQKSNLVLLAAQGTTNPIGNRIDINGIMTI